MALGIDKLNFSNSNTMKASFCHECVSYTCNVCDIVRVNISQRIDELWNTKIARSNYLFKQGEAPMIKTNAMCHVYNNFPFRSCRLADVHASAFSRALSTYARDCKIVVNRSTSCMLSCVSLVFLKLQLRPRPTDESRGMISGWPRPV